MDFSGKLKALVLAIGGVCLSMSAMADKATLIMPHCLEKAMKMEHQLKAYSSTLALVSVDDSQLDALALQAHKTHCGGFINVSDNPEAEKNPGEFLTAYHPSTHKPLKNVDYKISHQATVEALLKQVESTNIWRTLEGLTSFDDRYSRGDNGRKAALWIQDKFNGLVRDAKREDVESYLLETGGAYKQPSLVTVVGKDLKGDAVVLGAHMDTLSYMKPGADDDGSGSSSLMEAARVILNAEKLNVPVYFIWYSAEEMGLIGSQKVVKHFIKKQIPVKSVLQFDMTGYRHQGSDKIWMIDDNVDTSLSNFIEGLINKYIGVKVGHTRCNYACSDHASWTQGGFRSAFPVEAKFGNEDPYIHTGNDTMEYVSLEHMTNFAKLAVAYTIEMASK